MTEAVSLQVVEYLTLGGAVSRRCQGGKLPLSTAALALRMRERGSIA
jgi:hypothetical protein